MQTIKTFEELEERNTRIDKSKKSIDESDLQLKIDLALDFITKCFDVSNSPVCLTSFGKDSLVMLHLILQVKKIPVIYWREPFFQEKFVHPQKIAQEWDLDVYDYPPTFTDYLQLEDYFDVYNFYDTGNGTKMILYTGTRNYKKTDKKFLCAVNDLLLRPKVPSYDFKWDCIFHGHKQVDPVYITDRIELPKIKLHGKGIMALPIKDWSDEDIWAYIKKYDLPYNKERYDYKEEDRNNDVFPTCHDCLDYRRENKVYCPKLKKDINCVSKTKEQHLQFKNSLLNIAYK